MKTITLNDEDYIILLNMIHGCTSEYSDFITEEILWFEVYIDMISKNKYKGTFSEFFNEKITKNEWCWSYDFNG